MPTDPTYIDPAHAELLAKARAATPGPWHVEGTPNEPWRRIKPDGDGCIDVYMRRCVNGDADAAYIAAANPAAIIDLITQLGEARAAVKILQEEVWRLKDVAAISAQVRALQDSTSGFQRTPRQQKKFDKNIQCAARGTAAGEKKGTDLLDSPRAYPFDRTSFNEKPSAFASASVVSTDKPRFPLMKAEKVVS